MKRPRKHHGAHAPVLSIHVMNEFKGRSLARGRGRAKAVFETRTGQVQCCQDLACFIPKGMFAAHCFCRSGALQRLPWHGVIGRHLNVASRVNLTSPVLPISCVIHVRYSPGLRRPLAVHAKDRGGIQEPPS